MVSRSTTPITPDSWRCSSRSCGCCESSAGRRIYFAIFSGSVHAYHTLPPPTSRYCFPSSSYIDGELPTRPIPECQSVLPSLVRSAMTLLAESPENVTPVAVVSTPADGSPPLRSCSHLTLPVW